MPQTSKKTEIRETLVARILCSELPPGSELDEARLAGEFGLSRTPLREVHQQLAAEGYLTLHHNRGARIAPLGLDQIRGLFQTAPLLLATTARLAAQHRSPDQLDQMGQQLTQLEQAVEAGDVTQSVLTGHGVLSRMGTMGGNPYLPPSLNRMLIDLTRLGAGQYATTSKKEKKAARKIVAHKQAIHAAIAEQASDRAANKALALWEMTRTRIAQQVQPAPVPDVLV